jgi:hypothetical protein
MFSQPQRDALGRAVRVVAGWAFAAENEETVLVESLARQPDPQTLIGLATLSRLLTTELAIATGRSEAAVLSDLCHVVDLMSLTPDGPSTAGSAY